MPISTKVCALHSVTVGGISVGLYGCMSITEVDSRANMAVAGSNSTIIQRSGHYANVTPLLLSEVPTMEKVKIGDVALAYNNPVTLKTYCL